MLYIANEPHERETATRLRLEREGFFFSKVPANASSLCIENLK
jgi:hypothetical protein